MAKIAFKNQSEYFLRLRKLEEVFAKEATLEKAVYVGSGIVADQIRRELEDLPEERFRYLRDDDMFGGTPEGHRRDLVGSFGLTPIERDKNGFVHTKAGFEGYGSYPTNTYPQGVPNPLLARAIESGSSVREKSPFVAPAVKATRKEAIAAMERVIDEKIKEIF